MSIDHPNTQPQSCSLLDLGDQVVATARDAFLIFNQRNIILGDIPPHQRIFLFFLTRSIKTYSAILDLSRVGYGQDIATLLRSLLENLISSQYILTSIQVADERANRFVDYKWVVYRRYMSNEHRDPKYIDDILMKKLIERKAVVLEKYELFKKKYHVKSDKALITWSGRALRDMAKLSSQWLLQEYDSTFRLTSRFSHPSIIGDRAYVKHKDDTMLFSPFAARSGVLINFRPAIIYTLEFLTTFNTIFELNLNPQLNVLKDQLQTFPKETSLPKTNNSSMDKNSIKLKFNFD